ncbi:malate dehydrogenase [Rubrivirga sp. S365]|uniref:Malate dehydrogenase n=1 Tax=Rubrivirga litoralis TaxID=3075598 RepID=A0ABU3BV04_9BACT|nr:MULTISPECIES: malate dehydrogenase [unclassified Rubrivirga]MDT0633124.1 malate dehydrogenase [Rubrivirga sp. F394]MDT7855323.1 malate dehydrogenase [Rubrivirga sp. S365]
MKLTVVGAGNVGATVAECVARMDIVQNIALVDINEGVAQGKALDLMEAAPIHGFDTVIEGGADYAITKGSDVTVITAGLPRKPGMSRDDLLAKNAEIVSSVTRSVVDQSPDTTIIVVSNPLDVMTYVAYMESGFPSQRVMGMAGILDTARYRAFLKMELGVSVRDINAMLLGGHGDSMTPLPRFTTVGSQPVTDLIDEARLDEIITRTKKGGGEIVGLMGTSAWYAPGAGAAEMVEAIVKDSKRVLPCAAWVTGQYGLEDMFIGVPVKLGRGGVEEIVELDLNDKETADMKASGEHVREVIGAYENLKAQA